MKILITGASGFIGSHIAEEALRQGYEVWCAVRKTTSRKYLQDERLNFIELNLSSCEQLTEVLRPHHFDVVVHAAGATKCKSKQDFFRVNTEGTRNLVEAIKATTAPQPPQGELLNNASSVTELSTKTPPVGAGGLSLFIFISSLSVFGAIREEQPYEEIKLTDTPKPNTAYGESKLKAEAIVKESGLPYVILRPTGVYGPREKDYFLMVDSIKKHSDFAVGYKPQDITFVYVTDVVQAVMKAITQPKEQVVGKEFFLSDGEVYSSVTFSDLIIDELTAIEGKRPFVIRIKAPKWILRVVCALGEMYIRLSGKLITLNNDKYNILSQRNWRCDISETRRLLGYEPQVKLAEGVKRSIKWYKDNKWI